MTGIRSTLIVCGVAALLLPGPVGAEPKLPDPRLREGVETVLADAVDRGALEAFAGRPIDRCFPVASDTEVCQWSLGNRDAGWRALARTIDTRDRIALICELPTAGGARAANSCSAHPMRTNRDDFEVRGGGYGGRRSVPASELRRQRAVYQKLVASWIGAARTLDEMSRLMGGLPDRCVPTRGTDQVCRWKASGRLFGQGTVATWVGASTRKRIRFDCTFKLSGAPREVPCTAEIGG